MNVDMASSLSFLKEIKPAWENTSEVIFFFPLKFTVQPKKQWIRLLSTNIHHHCMYILMKRLKKE